MPAELRKITPDMLAGDPFHPARLDFEKGMSSAPAFALALIAANAAAFVWELSNGALRSKAGIIAAGAIYGPRVFAGEGWRLVTGMFLHGGFGHLAGNCLALYILGLAAQRAWGTGRALLIYFASGIFASLCSAFLTPMPAVGASGAIFGLAGAIIVFFYRYSGSFYLRSRRIGSALLGWALLELTLGALTPYVDNWAHLGGLAAGMAAGLLTPSDMFEKPAEREPSVG
jgi:rhomboid protease GluP